MSLLVTVLLGIAMLSVLLALFGGFYAMTRGSEFSRKHSNRFMRTRVLLQALALLLFFLLLLQSR